MIWQSETRTEADTDVHKIGTAVWQTEVVLEVGCQEKDVLEVDVVSHTYAEVHVTRYVRGLKSKPSIAHEVGGTEVHVQCVCWSTHGALDHNVVGNSITNGWCDGHACGENIEQGGGITSTEVPRALRL